VFQLGLLGCGSGERHSQPAALDAPPAETPYIPQVVPGLEQQPDPGAACEEEGAETECGKVVEQFGDYITCSIGTRTCSDGHWGECVGTRITQKPAQTSEPDLRLQALGSTQACPAGFDPCDPYCNSFTDAPGGFTAPPTFSNDASGLTPLPTGVGACTSLTLTPSSSTITVTKLSPLTVSSNPVSFTLSASPSGCVAAPFQTAWTVDKLDRAATSGTNNTNGQLTLAVPIAGTVRVTAFAAGLNVSTNISVRVNVVDAPTTNAEATTLGIPTGSVSTSTNINLFKDASGNPLAGTVDSTAVWLYPYAQTFFPLGLLAPVSQYYYTTATGNGKAVKLSLRYPANATVSGSLFNYSIVVKETNNLAYGAGVASANALDPQVVIPQSAWQYFEQTARGNDASLVVQRLRDVLEREKNQTIHFVDGQLKGTVYYNSYTSPQGGGTGAVLSIAPGASSPSLAVQPSGKCTACHSLNLDGTRLITNGGRSSNSYLFNQSRRYDMTTAGPSPSVLTSYDDSVAGDFTPGDYDVLGDRFTFGAPWKDGSLYMTHGGDPFVSGDRNWRAPNDYSKLYPVTANSTSSPALSVSNWSNVSAVSPRFSNDGAKLAFAFWGGSSTTLPCSSNAVSPCTGGGSKTLPAATGGTRLAVVDFSCSSPPCSSSSTGWKVSNARDLTPGVTQRVAWPWFTPDGGTVLYQRQFRASTSKSYGTAQSGTGPNVSVSGTTGTTGSGLITITTAGALGTARFSWSYAGQSGTNVLTAATKTLGSTGITASFPNTANYVLSTTYTWSDIGALGGGWSFSPINTVGGALAEIWMSKVPADGSSSVVPTRLLALNGLNPSPTCSATSTSCSSQYLPTVARTLTPPTHYHNGTTSYTMTQADNCSNTATLTAPLDYQLNYAPAVAPSPAGDYYWVVFTSRRMYGNVAYNDAWDAEPGQTCNSGMPQTKKLWIAAIDKNSTAGIDPSHPAFYLPGQELVAGNSHGHWVDSACTDLGGACASNDDCCNGTGSSPTAQCKVVSTATVPPSKQCQAASSCSSTGESCTTSGDCCTGLECPTGGGACTSLPSPVFSAQQVDREYVASCPYGTAPAWRFLEWQAQVPSGSSIDFAVQTRALPSDAYTPLVALLAASATSSTPAGKWERGASTVSQVLQAAGLAAQSQVRLLMTFNPNASKTEVPTLLNWRLIYDCLPLQ
jgi:hypothetical protein